MPLRSHSSYRTRPPTRVGEPLFERRQFSERDGADVFDGSEVEVVICASCNQAIRDPKGLGGHCFRCDRVVCTACAENRCAIHRKILCEDDATRSYDGWILCRADSFFQKVFFCLTRPPRRQDPPQP